MERGIWDVEYERERDWIGLDSMSCCDHTIAHVTDSNSTETEALQSTTIIGISEYRWVIQCINVINYE